jgi:EAL domain-containing protein (putative c-di-GMP-specific phosphodiesterase class I)
VLGVEALVRWAHPQRGLLPPAEFVQVAERTGLVHPLTESVLDQALAQVRRWLDDGRELPVAVNISTRSLLQPGFAERVLTALGRTGVPARLLGLEITETTIMEDPERALEVLTQLADAGIRLSIDDFGTGYSSLAYLKVLPVHELKIDRVFVAALTTSERDRVIVDSTSRSAPGSGWRSWPRESRTRTPWPRSPPSAASRPRATTSAVRSPPRCSVWRGPTG